MSAAADTIYALATSSAPAALAVVRISGPRAGEALKGLAGSLPPSRRASVRALAGPDRTPIDRAIVLWLPGPASVTGEDVAELHLHGGPAVVEAALDALCALGLRPARPGEFTRRGFENGKLDLTQAEAIADLVAAESAGQRAQALRQLSGELGRLYEGWRAALVDALALVEAEIDFPDEGDVPGGLAASAGARLAALHDAIAAHLADALRGARVREGFHVALLGAPNAGKSTLLNRLAGREAAIVTDIPGTTRDVVEARITLEGFHVNLSDTAGLRDSADPIEREGVRRARARAEEADLRIAVVDAARPDEAGAVAGVMREGDLAFINKTDVADPEAAGGALTAAFHVNHEPFHVNQTPGAALSGHGVEALRAALAARVRAALAPAEA
ncbi:MAG: tRNA uridine-5-carboxymethylaminomethyl(34) synthesis GTPase MnmE, partial [Caulobacterales bacterium]|nr:tRNA uridine-5-carboxymethylaminomethyl(34) synthesis GTPase MnmE [Caulobacterales bacterium]